MGRQSRHEVNSEMSYDEIDDFLDELDFDNDLNAQQESWQKKRRASKKRDARRRIEEYWDDRRLADMLRDYD